MLHYRYAPQFEKKSIKKRTNQRLVTKSLEKNDTATHIMYFQNQKFRIYLPLICYARFVFISNNYEVLCR